MSVFDVLSNTVEPVAAAWECACCEASVRPGERAQIEARRVRPGRDWRGKRPPIEIIVFCLNCAKEAS